MRKFFTILAICCVLSLSGCGGGGGGSSAESSTAPNDSTIDDVVDDVVDTVASESIEDSSEYSLNGNIVLQKRIEVEVVLDSPDHDYYDQYRQLTLFDSERMYTLIHDWQDVYNDYDTSTILVSDKTTGVALYEMPVMFDEVETSTKDVAVEVSVSNAFTVQNKIVYTFDGDSVLRAIDTSSATSYTTLSSLDLDDIGQVQYAHINNNILYAACQKGVLTVDVTNPEAMVLIQYSPYEHGIILEINAPNQIGSYFTGGVISVISEKFLVVKGTSFVKIYNISSNDKFHDIWIAIPRADALDVAIDNTHIYILMPSLDINIYKLTTGGARQWVGEIDPEFDSVDGIFAQNGYLIVGGSYDDQQENLPKTQYHGALYDVADPTDPDLIDYFHPTDTPELINVGMDGSNIWFEDMEESWVSSFTSDNQ